MKGESMANLINVVLTIIGIIGVFFADYFLTTWFQMSFFLFVCCTLILFVTVVYEGEIEEGDE